MKKNILYLIIIAAISITVACGGGNQGDTDEPTVVTKLTAPQLTTPESHGGGFGWANDKCFLCHPVSSLKEIHAYSPRLGASFAKVGDDDTGACLYCHGSNGLTVTAEDYQCMLCHKNADLVRSADMFDGSHMHDLNGDGEISNADCVVCHSFSDMNGEMNLAVDFTKSGGTYATTSDFCLTCHDGNGAFGVMPPLLTFDVDESNIYSTYMGTGDTDTARKDTADIHGIKDGGTQSFAVFRGTYSNAMSVPCLSCHQVHSSDNAYLITESGSSATLTDDDAKAASVHVTGDNNFSELCAVCHMTPNGAPTANGLTDVTHTSTYSSNCTDCHYHGAGYGSGSSNLF